MFKSIISRLLLVTLIFRVSLFAQNSDEETEKKAIIKVLWDSELAFFSGDSLLYGTCFPQDRDGLNLGYGLSIGPWHKFELSQPIRNGQSRLPVASLSELLIHRDYFMLIDHDLAWATFIQELKQPKKTGVISTLRRLNRTLIKQNGAWKIINNTWVELDCQPTDNKYIALMEQVINFLMKDKAYQKALDLAKLLHQWYPNSAQALGNIGYFYDQLGQKEFADEYFKKTLTVLDTDELLPDNTKTWMKKWLENRFKTTPK